MRTVGLVALVVAVLAASAGAATWNDGYIKQLPDSAFAIVKRTPDGKALRRLPHHDDSGALDIPHLCSALSRWHQVHWQDPAAADVAWRHLAAHRDEAGPKACRPGRTGK
jgi:hypothetical protein